MTRFDLGGVGYPEDRTTVNVVGPAQIVHDFTDLDAFCQDGTVDEFYLRHALEHVPALQYRGFLLAMERKLRPGGTIRVVQTDVGRTMRMWACGQISFRTLRTTVFTPPYRLRQNPHNAHCSMWSQEELIRDFRVIGMDARGFDAGGWVYDMDDELCPEDTRADHGKWIPQLGVLAAKRREP